MKQKAALFWSGGKDSAMALYTILKDYPEVEILYLVTTINEQFRRISMHGIREELLEVQAGETGIPLYKMIVPNIPSNDTYETALNNTFTELKREGLSHVIFGDIFLEDLKQYRLGILESHGLSAIFPLWGKVTSKLMTEFLEAGFATLTCCINTESLNEEHLAKELNETFLSELPPVVDPCGENGEFHTFCFKGPVFKNQILFKIGEKQFKPIPVNADSSNKDVGFWFVDLLPLTLKYT